MTVRPIALLLACLLPVLSRAASPVAEPPTGAGDLVVRLSDGFGELETSERLVLEVWGDGRVVVRRPAFLRGSRVAEAFVSGEQVRALVQRLADEGVIGFDAEGVRAALRRADEERSQLARERPGEVRLVHLSDPDPSTIEVRLARWLPEGEGGPVEEDVVRVVEWNGVIADAVRHPQVAAIAGMRRAQDDVRALLALPGLR